MDGGKEQGGWRMAGSRSDTFAHQRGFTSLPLRALRAFRLSAIPVPTPKNPFNPLPKSVDSPPPRPQPFRASPNTKPLSCLTWKAALWHNLSSLAFLVRTAGQEGGMVKTPIRFILLIRCYILLV